MCPPGPLVSRGTEFCPETEGRSRTEPLLLDVGTQLPAAWEEAALGERGGEPGAAARSAGSRPPSRRPWPGRRATHEPGVGQSGGRRAGRGCCALRAVGCTPPHSGGPHRSRPGGREGGPALAGAPRRPAPSGLSPGRT